MTDSRGGAEPNPKDLVGRTKPGVATFPMTALFEAGAVTRHGADKYGPFNWRDRSIAASVYFDAALRHLCAWFEGEDVDPESGYSHLAHVIAGMAILRDAMVQGKLLDDRPKPTAPGWIGRTGKVGSEA